MSPSTATDPHPAPHALDEALASLRPEEAAALQWLVRREDGLSATDEQAFQAWLAQDTAHQRAFGELTGVWQDFDAIPQGDITRWREAAASSSVQTTAPATPAPPRATPHARASAPWGARLRHLVQTALQGSSQPRPWGSRAVTIGAASLALGLGWFAWNLWQQPIFHQQYVTARGQQLDIGLPDGSTLKLDTATRADATLYRQRREVRLTEGQALFHVHGNKAQPFDVLAGATRITVVGTRFSVRYTPSMGDREVEVAVSEGRVRVARADDTSPSAPTDVVELTAGQTVVAAANGHLGPVGRLGSEGIAPWQGRRLSFYDTPLSAALAELERYGPTGMVISDPAVAALHVTGTVDLNRVRDFTRSLPRVLPIRLDTREGITHILAAKAP